MKKFLKYVIAVVTVAGIGIVLFSLIGAGVFLLPLLGGAFTAK